MKTKSWIIVLILFAISLIANGILGFLLCKKRPERVIERVDSINTIIDTIYKDNIQLLKVVKEGQASIKQLESDYEKDYISISNQSTDSDYLFFEQYLQQCESKGHFSKDYSDSTKTN